MLFVVDDEDTENVDVAGAKPTNPTQKTVKPPQRRKPRAKKTVQDSDEGEDDDDDDNGTRKVAAAKQKPAPKLQPGANRPRRALREVNYGSDED